MKEVTDMNKSNKTALEISDLSVRYHEDWVLKDLYLTLPQGSRVAIVGPNGAGKSTLFKASLGLIPRQSGQIRFLNQPLERVQRQIAYLPQQAMIDWDFPITVKEVVMMGPAAAGLYCQSHCPGESTLSDGRTLSGSW